MSSLAPNTFPPPPLQPSYDMEHGDTSIVNAPLDPQPPPAPSTRWYFDKEQLMNTPSRRAGIDEDKELTYRQQSANYIQDMGQRLQVNQLCINTAIVYMHRFFMYHSFHQFQKNAISTASIFLAAKVEEQPRKLEYVIKIAHYCLHRDSHSAIDVKSEAYVQQSTELVSHENILLQTLGFDVSVDHPHTHVVKCCQLVRASKDLAQTSYFMATNSLHLTTMCLEYPPSVVACVCIHLACKWSNWEIPRSKEGKEWYFYVDGSVTPQQLESLTSEFLTIFNKSPSRLKKRILNLSNATTGGSGGSGGGAITNFPTHFTVDRNSSGAQTIKSRSRSPSPTSTQAAKPTKQGVPPAPSVKHKPNPLPTAAHYSSKPAPPPATTTGYPPKHPTHSSKPPPPYPHGAVGGPRPSYREMINVSRQSLANTKQVQSHSNGIHIQNSHQKNSYPPTHHAQGPGQSRTYPQHHTQSSSQLGSQPPPHSHHAPPNPNPLVPPPGRQSLLKPQQHQSAQPHKNVVHPAQKDQSLLPPKYPSFPHHAANGNQSSSAHSLSHMPPRQPYPTQPQVSNSFQSSSQGSGGRSVPAVPEHGKKRPVDPSADDPAPKRSRPDGVNFSNLTTVSYQSADEKSFSDILKPSNVKMEPGLPSSATVGEDRKVDVKPSISVDVTGEDWGLDKDVDMKYKPPVLPAVKTEPIDQPLASMSITSTFPLLSSEIGLGGGSTSSALPVLQSSRLPSGIKVEHHSPPASQEANTSLPLPSPTTSSSKKKKKKKEHKHKKDKEDKSHRHRDKEEKKSKKDKHRDRDGDRQKSKKKKKGKGGELGISQVQDNSSLKIKIVASKEAVDSKSARASGRNMQSNTVVYY